MRNEKTYDYIDDVETYKNSNTIDLGFEDDFADDPDMGVYIPQKTYRTSESKDLYSRDDWMMKRDRLLINLRHEINLCNIDNEKDKKAYLDYWGNPYSLNKKANESDKEQFLPWLPEDTNIGKDNTYGGRRIVKVDEDKKQERKAAPFNWVLKEEVRKDIRKNYSFVSIQEDGKTVIFREYNLDDDDKRQKSPYTFKFVDSLQSKIDEDSNVSFNKEDNKFYFSDETEHEFNEEIDYKTISKTIEETDYQLNEKGEKKPTYKTVRDITKPNKGIQGYHIELMYGYMSLIGRDPDLGKKKVNGEWKYYQLMKEVYENGKLISKDKKWNNRCLRKNVKDNQGNVIKQIPFQPTELKDAIQKCINIYEGDNKKERFINLIDVMKKERAEAKERANLENEINPNQETSTEESTVNE